MFALAACLSVCMRELLHACCIALPTLQQLLQASLIHASQSGRRQALYKPTWIEPILYRDLFVLVREMMMSMKMTILTHPNHSTHSLTHSLTSLTRLLRLFNIAKILYRKRQASCPQAPTSCLLVLVLVLVTILVLVLVLVLILMLALVPVLVFNARFSAHERAP